MKHFCFIILTLLISPFTNAQPSIQGQVTIGGKQHDGPNDMILTKDGGYAIAGFSSSAKSGDKTQRKYGEDDFWVIKLTRTGEIEWQKTFGGSLYDGANAIVQTKDEGYLVGGNSYSDISGNKTTENYGQDDYWIIKLDKNGNIQWQKTYGGILTDVLESVCLTKDGGFMLGGYSNSPVSGNKNVSSIANSSDCWLIKTDSIGNIQWQKVFGGYNEEFFGNIEQTKDQGYIFSASSMSGISGNKTEDDFGESLDYWIVKIDEYGEIQWQRTLGGVQDDYAEDIREISDGGYIVGGYSYSNISGNKRDSKFPGINTADMWVIKLDSNGNTKWQNDIGGTKDDRLFSLEETKHHEYILGGSSASDMSGDKTDSAYAENHYDFWVVKINANGKILWDKTIGGLEDEDYADCTIHQTKDEGYALTGASFSGISDDKTDSCRGDDDIWFIKLSPDNTIQKSNVSDNTNNSKTTRIDQIKCYPNPVKNKLVITVQKPVTVLLYNQSKQLLLTKKINNMAEIEMASFPSGIYYLLNGEKSILAKIIKE